MTSYFSYYLADAAPTYVLHAVDTLVFSLPMYLMTGLNDSFGE